MLLLDTDHFTLLERGGGDAVALQLRLGQTLDASIATTIVTYDEQMRGWLSYMARADTTEKMVVAYSRLQRHIETFRNALILPFDDAAAAHFNRLRQARIRIGTSDLKIPLSA